MYPCLSTKKENESRKDHDFYSTPEETTRVLLDYLKPILNPNLDVIMEPACGEGMMAEVIRRREFKVDATDLYEYEYGHGKWERDFLEMDGVSASWIITNPPFNLAEEFITHANILQEKNDHGIGFAMLLKSNYWHAKTRLSLFQTITPAVILPLTWRPRFNSEQKAPILDMAWNIWTKKDYSEILGGISCKYVPVTKPEIN
jgi:hypothetical protein